MFRRQFLRQSRSLSKSLTELPQAHLQRSPFSSATFISPRASTFASLPSRLQQRRWQSSDSDKSKASSEAATSSTEESKPADPKPEDVLKEELEKTKREVIDLKDKYLRSVADYRNLQDRTRRDMESARQFAIQRFASDLLDSIDNLDRALSSVPASALGKTQASGADSNTTASEGAVEPNKDLQNLFSGLKMTEEILLNTLQKHGLERFDPMENGGRKFDPNTDEATFFTKVEGKEDGDVFFTQSKGYKLNGRVVRAAKVGIVKNS